ncbi:glycoside hydrolase family 39 protein [Cucurbitaria berberidis CBS 394.84]|uniref:Glycoside hydrolase family 39 protein n=1 Tax=Cucurbitaria berberidis CBS 394.84 TaxID=1168544 RepID=A0A9P4L8A4_9PLEO|nr:glycoside hydrolase family 39 protein [Cucurbitaria berberidis CBS 394.84]KAF1845871.1 glycoside hydrolase family 39 protein [Cucurbitaria berberidis CBS 394.84]
MATEYLQSLEVLPIEKRDQNPPVTGSAVVFLDQKIGSPQHLASGWIYGIPDTPGQIPDEFYTEVGFRYGRGGGSQLPDTRGWYRSKADYEARFQSALSNYRTTRKYGGNFILLPSALWGADGGQSADAPYPGDNDDWSSWDDLITTWIRDAKAHDMLEGLVFDIWNEPDLHFFWNRPREQWLQLWSRTYRVLRREVPNVRISGPCFSEGPDINGEWWNEYLAFVKQDNSVPDEWSWHMEQGHGNMSTSMSTFRELLNRYSIPESGIININEYGIWAEQVPSAAVWFISQLERENAFGLRGNWTIAGSLHDYLAGLVSKPGAGTEKYSSTSTGYYPTAEYHVYKYYGSEMNGQRLKTSSNDKRDGEAYAVLGTDKVRILAGSRNATGNWAVDVRGGETVGYASGEEVDVRVLEFSAKDNHFDESEGPKELGIRKATWQDGSLRLEIHQENPLVAYAFEFAIKV